MDSPLHNAHAAAPYCGAYDPETRTPQLQLPPLNCDCHAHICGPARIYPYAAERIYTPPDALLPDYLNMLAKIGVQRSVLVQPSVYGTDNSVMLKAMAAAPIPCRGVAVIDSVVTDSEIEQLHQVGVRGARFNLVDVQDPSGRVDLSAVRALAERVKPFGWHVEFLLHADEYPDLDSMFSEFPVDIVFAHCGYLRPPLSVDNNGFQALLRLLREGQCWVKLTGPTRITAEEMPYADVTPVVRALLNVAPGQLVWGSDWPHVKLSKPMPNDGDLVDLLATWIPDPGRRRQILVDNPNRLYDFDD
ncbi:MAG: amidohydrolase family protein [Deltaproteobacteria bacterium]|nr:amidohydrolase family protein [Deltaproteobacteria bacterium]